MGFWYNESRSFVAGNSEGLIGTKKGSSRLPEMLVNKVYFCWKERAALQFCEMHKCRISGLMMQRYKKWLKLPKKYRKYFGVLWNNVE